MKLKSRKKLLIFILLSTLVLIFIVFPFAISIYVYEDNFGNRFASYEPLSYTIDDFPGLRAERFIFESDKGQELVGYKYYMDKSAVQDEDEPEEATVQFVNDYPPLSARGVIVFAHGLGGGGHNSYMVCAEFFARNGYVVFAFDATGNDESGGKAVGGLPQGVIDLDYALRFVESSGEFEGLPVMLFGHSWGGYSAGCVLATHPEVRAVAMFSGINSSSDLIEVQGRTIAGDAIGLLMPYFRAYEALKFGGRANVSCMDGFEKSDAGVMVIHSADDATVPIDRGYDIYYKKYAEDERFIFVRYEDRGHDRIFYSDEARAYIDAFNDNFADYAASLENGLTPDLKAQYIEEHLDRGVWTDKLDDALFMDILAFFDAHAG